jgi:hypothetical protein
LLCEISSDGRPQVVSLGRDGKRGGEGDDADVHCSPWLGEPAHPGLCGCIVSGK